MFDGTAPSHEPVQYVDIAEWQNEILESDDTKSGLEYWRDCNFFRARPLVNCSYHLTINSLQK
jgi:hypothetical protein